jgi:hypothetical protein
LLLPASLAGPCRPGPPRCYVDLQRLTAIASRSFGFPAPPAPFDLSVRTLAFSRWRLSVDFSAGLFAAHGLARTLEDRDLGCVRSVRLVHVDPASVPSCSRGVSRPSGAPSPGDPCPGSAVRAPNIFVAFPALPRRGVPFPRRPPSPFLTTLTVCSPPDPVVCFNHSRPWGLASLTLAEARAGGFPVAGSRLVPLPPPPWWRWFRPRRSRHPKMPIPASGIPGFPFGPSALRPLVVWCRSASRDRSWGSVAFLPVVSARRLRRSVPFRASS